MVMDLEVVVDLVEEATVLVAVEEEEDLVEEVVLAAEEDLAEVAADLVVAVDLGAAAEEDKKLTYKFIK